MKTKVRREMNEKKIFQTKKFVCSMLFYQNDLGGFENAS